ncbi:hypothetical protein AHAS_Ahas04G0015900 [Arachis hypogaea]
MFVILQGITISKKGNVHAMTSGELGILIEIPQILMLARDHAIKNYLWVLIAVAAEFKFHDWESHLRHQEPKLEPSIWHLILVLIKLGGNGLSIEVNN